MRWMRDACHVGQNYLQSAVVASSVANIVAFDFVILASCSSLWVCLLYVCI